MTIVLDASIAVKFVVREHDTEQARRLLAAPDPLIAPDWVLVEIAATLWKKVRRSELPAVHAERHLDDMTSFFQQLYPATELVAQALSLGVRLRHSVYDCLYAALAIREGAMLVTADQGLADAMAGGGLGDRVRLLSQVDGQSTQ